jgi:hypothetical protein
LISLISFLQRNKFLLEIESEFERIIYDPWCGDDKIKPVLLNIASSFFQLGFLKRGLGIPTKKSRVRHVDRLMVCRGERIRTSGLVVPNDAR